MDVFCVCVLFEILVEKILRLLLMVSHVALSLFVCFRPVS